MKIISTTITPLLLIVLIAIVCPFQILAQPVWQANILNSSEKRLKCEVTDNTHWHDTYGKNSACVYAEGTVEAGTTKNFSLPLANCPVLQDPPPPHLAITPDANNIGIVCYADNQDYIHTECFQMIGNVASGSTVTMSCPSS